MPVVKNDDHLFLQIKETLKEMNGKQIVYFSWLCAVRTFPLLGASRITNFRSEKLTRYLYAILRSLDITLASIECIRTITATDAATTAIVSDDVDASHDDDTRLAVKAVSYAAYTAYAANTDATAAAEVAADVAMNAVSAACYHKINLSDILLEDIRFIKQNEYALFFHDTTIYGEIWDRFQNALSKLGGAYWGKLYEDLFQNGFVMPLEALERRINIPVEIQEQGARVVGLYLEKLEAQGGRCLDEARIIILGEKGAGKTCLAHRLSDPGAPMTGKEESTEGVATTLWKINDRADTSDVNVHIWDFAGHVITHAAHRCFLSERCLYMIVYDGRSEERNRLGYWLEHVRNYGGDAPVRVLINLFDEHRPDIPENTLKEKYPYIKDFSYLSIAKDTNALKKFRDETAELIQSNPMWNCLAIPASYVKVKEELEKRFHKDSVHFYNEYISKDVFDWMIAKHCIENANAVQLLKDLHALGICLWYHDIEGFDTLVLNPEWISHGIYRMINWAHNNLKHTVCLADYGAVFAGETDRYPKDKLSFLFKLMKKYELAYSREADDAITIPGLLREDQPQNLPSFPIEESLLIQYEAEQALPANTVSRLIVRHNEEIRSNSEVWRHGVILKFRGDTVAMVKEDERKIIIKAKGDDKSACIARLRNTMNDIFSSYKGNKPELQYKIIINEPIVSFPHESDENKALMLPEETIRNCLANGRPDYYYPQADMDIPLDRTAHIYHIHATNATFGPDSPISSSVINFNGCNVALQGEMGSLARLLDASGYTDEAEELKRSMSDLESIEELEAKQEIIKSGGLTRLKNFLEEVNDETSPARKAVGGIRYGVKSIQSIAKMYNDIAQWMGLPQVPRPFLGEN